MLLVALTLPAISSQGATFANPVHTGADPTIVWAKGQYHFSCTTGRDIRVWSAPTLGGLKSAAPTVVYRATPGSLTADNFWAPEFLRWNGRIYIHFAADDGRDENHRLYVLRSRGSDPRGPYDFLGPVRTPGDQWAIDGFAFPYRGGLYMFWSGWQSAQSRDQRIYIARMRDPGTIVGARVELSHPEFAWERRGWPVNEGPAPIAHGRAVSLTYSGAGGSTPGYAIGRLFNPSGDLMNPKAWTKEPDPVFVAGNGMFAPGHNSFFTARDGRPYLAFHAKREDREGWGGRVTAVRPVSFDARGRVQLGGALGWSAPLSEPR